ncbi:hypothetical protein DBR32_10730 [Taibaiella sp. KBW10]|uniref:type IX secretion system motor protein PorM/GldM n=1 Tax=Taibaiella sp. KBW10 TaxID=2153357 RepID=UPI000F58F3BD|nr:gliding motility protein GldM [Taibaiella sp. KBW10]RQO30057.1 hypothetical protein DBR32_10730 [Taibaiella sp. KBW10]
MSIPKEPRQLMINLMYLVLTAMLALNITKEVLDAFSTINTSIENSNAGIADKNSRLYKAFEHIADKMPDLKPRADSLYKKALQVKEESDKMSSRLEQWKSDIVAKAGGWVQESNGGRKVKFMDDIDIPSRMFIEEKNGDKVKSELEAYINSILAKGSNAETKEELKKLIPLKLGEMSKTDMNPSGDWSFGTFHNIPVIAAITLFSKWQSDVKNTESVMIETLMSQVGNEDFDPTVIKFDGLMAVAVPNTSYALAGDEITANVTMAAYNKAAMPTVTSNVGAVTVKDGVGTVKFRASGTGVQTVRGTITVKAKGASGRVETQPWSFNVTVGSAGASLQLDYMNVMYIGVDNPVTLSASGYNIDDVTWSMPGATITKVGNGQYNVTVTTPNYKGVEYTISAKNKAGQVVKVGGGLIRIKSIPTPNVKMGSIDGSGTMAAGEFKVQKGLAAILEGFDFKFQYLVTRYKVLRISKGNDVAENADGTGPLFENSPAVKALLNKAKPGDRYIFEQIYVKGTGNPERPAKGAINVLIR